MLPIQELDERVAQSVELVLTDIDDTLTTEGKLEADAYGALWDLQRAGVDVVVVTGRPAGWCDLIARQWPVAGVVGENGALAFWEHGGSLQRLYHPSAVADANRLDDLKTKILRAVPGSRVSKDQFARMFDLAIDFCEEPPDLGMEAADAILAQFEQAGARAKVSSIHVNGWFGDYDKLSMVELFVAKVFGSSVAASMAQSAVFCGDSPNDEPMFRYFDHAVGVRNFEMFAQQCDHCPRYITDNAGGAGFAELVDVLLAGRG